MSNSRLSLTAPTGTVEISVRDAALNVVANGFGDLKEDLPPGIYQIEYRAGERLTRELVALRPGETFENAKVDLPFASPVPLEGTSTSSETHRAALDELCALPMRKSDGQCSLLIFIRAMRADPALGFHRDAVRDWELLDTDLRPVLDIGKQIKINARQQWMGLSVLLPAGGYVLRIQRDRHPYDQAIWLSEGWTTGLFMTQTGHGPWPEQASIHMAPLAVRWIGNTAKGQYLARVTELALSGLREGRAVVPPRTLSKLLQDKFQNPMLGILGAHCLLLQREPGHTVIGEVLARLKHLVPEHPDLIALQQLSAKKFDTPSPANRVTAPPMLHASYMGLLACDAGGTGVFARGLLAESIAPRLLHQGSWTAWHPLAPLRRGGAGSGLVFRDLRLPSMDWDAAYMMRTPEYRINRYLQELREFAADAPAEDLLAGLTLSRVCLDTGLPAALVEPLLDALREGRTENSPPPENGPGASGQRFLSSGEANA